MGSRVESHELNTRFNEACHDPNNTPEAEPLRVSGDSRVPISAQKPHISRPAPAKLFRQTYLLSLVSLYSCLCIFAWTIICVQTKRPITTDTYSYVSGADDLQGVLANRMKNNAEWFRAAKVLLAISNTLIMPLTSTVCASAAVIYVQNFGRRRHFSMQHTATLADKGWSSPQVWLTLLSIKGWKSRGSYFLAFAMGLQALDVYDLFGDGLVGPTSLQTTRLRNELASVSRNDFQPNTWQEGTPQCSSNSSNNYKVSPECNQGGITFDSISALKHPYVAQLPAGYQTGLTTQFMPRMNSSVSLQNVSRTAFPSDCNAKSGAYYIDYSYNTTLLDVQVCMPDGVSQSPWKATRDRQDTTETMFLNIQFGSSENLADFDTNPANSTIKLTINTTLGYFELPNYNNSGIAGPLLAKEPQDTCPGNEDECLSQWQSKRSLQTNESSSSWVIDNVFNLGPLGSVITNPSPPMMDTTSSLNGSKVSMTQEVCRMLFTRLQY